MGRYSQQFVFGREGGKNTCRWKVRVNGKKGRGATLYLLQLVLQRLHLGL